MKNYESSINVPLRHWAEDDRPREKLLRRGAAALSDAELVAILIGSGSRNETAVDLARRILGSVEHDVNMLGRQSIKQLVQFKGMGEAKAISIVAAMELGRRRLITDIKEKPLVSSSKDAYNAIASMISDLPHEEFWMLLLNRANKIIGRERISSGGIAGTVVDSKIVFKKAIDQLACGIILCHNHPSGSLRPSDADIDLTRKLKIAGQSLDVAVLDHLIISSTGYYSFADEGML